MTQVDKLKERLVSRPADFTWNELRKILSHMGYQELKSGKTGGSRRKFMNQEKALIILHKPHPGNVLKRYQLDQIIAVLTGKNQI